MSEYEYADLISEYWGNAGAYFTLYVTVVSAYLIAAFLAGAKLTRSQNFILSFGFVVFTVLATWAFYGSGMTAVYYTEKLLSLEADSPQRGRSWVSGIGSALMLGGTFASLYFMWGIRRQTKP